MKRIAILTDIHSNYFALKRILNELSKEKIDDYIICGDLITDGFESEAVVGEIRKRTSNFVLGNRELSVINADVKTLEEEGRWSSILYTHHHLSDESFSFLKTLPYYKVIEIEGKRICFSHGSPYYVRDRVFPDRESLFDVMIRDFPADIYIFGHTHTSFCKFYKGHLFLNSGAVSLGVDIPCCSTYGVLTIDGGNMSYEERKISYSFDEIKNYYLNSDYHEKCLEWCNLILYTIKIGKCFETEFIDYLQAHNNLSWHEAFVEFMGEMQLEIL